ncbi:MAG: TrmH family RNA methyltransferase [Parachlamydiales bacterium]
METIRSLSHPNVKRLYKLRTRREAREEERRCVIYSALILKELKGVVPLRELWVSGEVPAGLEPERLILTTPEVIRKISGLQSGEDLLGVVDLPAERPLTGERLLLLDRIADPGNMGTLIRTALALGWDGVYFVEGGADPFNEKVLRASRGALFHLPYQRGSVEGALLACPHHKLLVADAKGEEAEERGALLLALGNEAAGPDPSLRKRGKLVGIPISPQMESLNVAIAGGILLYKLGPYGKR